MHSKIFDAAFNIPNALDAREYNLGNIIMKTRMIIKREKGVAALEFAIVLPVLVLLAVGICEFGIILYNQQVIINASREGARAGTTREVDTDGISQIVNAYCQGRLVTFGSDVGPQTTFPDGPNAGDFQADFSVRVTYNYQFLVSWLFGLGLNQPLRAITLMSMEAAEPAGS